MPKPKGLPKTGGRTLGTPNKKTATLLEICQERGVDVWAALLDLCRHEEPSIKLAALKECASYLFPKRKALEVSGDKDNPLAVNSSLEIIRRELEAESNERKQPKS